MERNGGRWTEARFHSFVKGGLRSISMRWPPKHEAKKRARVRRGVYRCAGYRRKSHEVPATLPPSPGNKKRINNSLIDHIIPVIDPNRGFTTWDRLIKRLFCEEDGLQLLCRDCHLTKTKDERNSK